MKTVALEIEMICYFNSEGIYPIKFRYLDGGSEKVIKVDKVVSKTLERLCGNKMFVYDCQSTIDGVERLFQLKLDIENHKWILFKI